MKARRRNSFWAVGDQVVASAGNFVLTAIVARTASRDEFGAFALTFAVYLIALGLARSFGGIALLIAHDRPEARFTGESASTIVLLLGTAMSVLLIGAAAVLTDGAQRSLLSCLGLALPGLLLFDTGRHREMSKGNFVRVAAADSLWLVMQAVVTGVLWLSHEREPWKLLAAWGFSGAGACVAVEWLPQPLTTRALASTTRANWGLFVDLAGEFSVSTALNQMIPFLIASSCGLGAAGDYRACLVLLGPGTIVVNGLSSLVLLEAKRLLVAQPRRFPAFLILWMAVVSAAIGATGLAYAWMPDIGHLLLGPRWANARQILASITVGMCFLGPVWGMIIGLRCLAQTRRVLVLRAVGALPLLLLVLRGAGQGTAAAAATGYAWGMGAAALCALLGAIGPVMDALQRTRTSVAMPADDAR